MTTLARGSVIDLDAIARRIESARQVHGDDFAQGSIDFSSGELTPRPTGDVLRDQDLVTLFREVRRLRLALRQDTAIQLLREAYDLLTNPDTRLDLRDWKRSAAPWVEPEA
jgi:hypothetical protein